MFLNWRERCPCLDSEVFRVPPWRAASARPWPKPREGGGGPLLYSNDRVQILKPFLAKLGLPEVTSHSALNLACGKPVAERVTCEVETIS